MLFFFLLLLNLIDEENCCKELTKIIRYVIMHKNFNVIETIDAVSQTDLGIKSLIPNEIC